MHSLYDDYDREFLSFIASKELRIPVDVKSGKALGLHARSWRAAAARTVEWRPAKGAGTVVSHVVFHRQYAEDFPVPYTVALVELTEGPRLLGRLVDVGAEGPAAGMMVNASFDTTGLVFRPPKQKV
jgi:hypothetical protein